MIVPRMTLPKGYAEACRVPGQVYTDLDRLLTDARDTFEANPGSQVRSVDDPSQGRIGVEICVEDADLLHWWEMYIRIEDAKTHPLWDRLKTPQGRQKVFLEQFQHKLILAVEEKEKK